MEPSTETEAILATIDIEEYNKQLTNHYTKMGLTPAYLEKMEKSIYYQSFLEPEPTDENDIQSPRCSEEAEIRIADQIASVNTLFSK
jgi:hypothetical protein